MDFYTSLQAKFIVTTTLVAAVATLVATGSFLYYQSIFGRHAVEHEIQALARVVANSSAAALAFGDAQTAGELIEALRGNPDVIRGEILTKDGKRFATRDFVAAGTGERLEITQPIFLESDRLGDVRLLASLSRLHEERKRFILIAGAIALAAIVFAVLLSTILRRLVILPVIELTGHVLSVRSTGLLREQASFTDRRRDEIGVLFREFNAMLRQLGETRRSLLEQSYYTGLAEAAAGVLHNIRNALNPMAVAGWRLRQTAETMLVKHLDTALDELECETTPPERRAKLVQYLRHTAARLLDARAALTEQADLVSHQVGHIERILSSFSRRDNPLREAAPIDVRRLVEGSVQLAQQNRAAGDIRIEIDDSIDRAPPILGHEIIVSQILGNLVVNASESIAAARAASGLIRLTARTESLDGRDMLCLEILDNGHGIEPALLERIFERGFTTRAKEYGGIGLHWCANSALAMGGKLTAHSDGPGTGASFELRLPTATAVAPDLERVA